MKLYIKQKVFQLLEHFYVKDELGQDKYEVKAKAMFTWGLKLYVYDMQGREVAYLEQKPFSLLPTFDVFVRGIKIATVNREFSLFKPIYSIDGLNWKVTGDFTGHDYTIEDAYGKVMTLSKEWFTWGDSYVLDIFDTKHEIEALAIVLAIDHVMDSNKNDVNIHVDLG